jgi:ribosomal protein S18 acetylase RimI-like enzyme
MLFDASSSSRHAQPREPAAAFRIDLETLTLRTGTPADLGALEALECRAFLHDRISRRSFARFLNLPSASLIIADCDGVLSGYALVLFRAGSRLARIYSIAVDAEHVGQGIGSKLLKAAEVVAFGKDVRGMRLEVSEQNAAARNLYRRSGYVVIGRLPAYYPDDDALRLQKIFI